MPRTTMNTEDAVRAAARAIAALAANVATLRPLYLHADEDVESFVCRHLAVYAALLRPLYPGLDRDVVSFVCDHPDKIADLAKVLDDHWTLLWLEASAAAYPQRPCHIAANPSRLAAAFAALERSAHTRGPKARAPKTRATRTVREILALVLHRMLTADRRYPTDAVDQLRRVLAALAAGDFVGVTRAAGVMVTDISPVIGRHIAGCDLGQALASVSAMIQERQHPGSIADMLTAALFGVCDRDGVLRPENVHTISMRARRDLKRYIGPELVAYLKKSQRRARAGELHEAL